MYLDEHIDKRVHFGSAPNARAKKISNLRPDNRILSQTLLDIRSCYMRTKHWNKLPHAERILLELRWTDLMLRLLAIGNNAVMHSLHYKLREQTPEEDDHEETITVRTRQRQGG